jgi:putative DNA primase/helicase
VLKQLSAAQSRHENNGKLTKADIEGATERPEALKVKPSGIPAELREPRQWVCWRFDRREGKWTKVPIDPSSGKLASCTDPATWGTFERAMARYQKGGLDGVGFVFTRDDDFAGVDLDDSRDPETGLIEPGAQEILTRLNSYTEVSPTGTGVKVFLKAAVPPGGNRKAKVEMYDHARFFTITGRRLPDALPTVKKSPKALARLHAELFPEPPPKPVAMAAAQPNGLTDDQIISKATAAKNGAKFKQLWAGDTTGYRSHSEADLALCGLLKFWTGPDAERIDRLFRKSGLMRDKWNRVGPRVLAKALEGNTEFYKPLAAPGDDAPDISEPGGRTDDANAKRFVLRFGRKTRWCAPWKKWLVWDGRRWKPDDTERIWSWAGKIGNHLWAELSEVAGALRREEANKVITFCRHSNGARATEDMIKKARGQPGIPITHERLDADPWLLNCLNGTLDLGTGRLRKHRQEDYLTKLCPVEYDPDAKCPQWIKFLRRVMNDNKGLVRYLQRSIGYALTGEVTEQCLWFLYGTGANGKSTFTRTVQDLLGDYACQAAPDLLMAKKYQSHPTEWADLFGKRFVVASEAEQGKRFAEAVIKEKTGGEKVKGRGMHQDFFEFVATHKFFLCANHKPVIRGKDWGIWRRFRLVPFTVTIPEGERDPRLLDKLREEFSGILAWAVRGCRRWQETGLMDPPEVLEATENYRRESDLLQQFLDEVCVLRPDVKTQASRLLEAYRDWTGDRFMTQKALAAELSAKGFQNSKGHANRKFWLGIGVPDDFGCVAHER